MSNLLFSRMMNCMVNLYEKLWCFNQLVLRRVYSASQFYKLHFTSARSCILLTGC